MLSMKVLGHTVTKAEQDAAFAVMQRERFKAADVVAELERLGVPKADFVSNRVADRLLQAQRRAGKICASSGGWWTPARVPSAA